MSRASAPTASASRMTGTRPSPVAETPPSQTGHPSGAYGVMANWPSSTGNYSVYLIAADGTVAATAQATMPTIVTCQSAGNKATPYLPPPVSNSNSRAYFMDASGDVRTLLPDGNVSGTPVIRLPIGPTRWSFFSVSPDDTQMAVAVVDYSSSVPTTSLYLDQLRPGGSDSLTFTQSDAYTLWPIGWRAGQLVLAKVQACPGAFGPTYWALELHVVDPATAARQLTIGGTGCVIAGPPTPGGVLCETHAIDFVVDDWSGNSRLQEPSGLNTQDWAYLSPNGGLLAVWDGSTLRIPNRAIQPPNLAACGWIDDSHLLGVVGLAANEVRSAAVGTLSDGQVTRVAANGVCAGRIPGGL